MDRGGSYNYGTNAGVFDFHRNIGEANTSNSFRSVLSAE
jgi:hypothetical protein